MPYCTGVEEATKVNIPSPLTTSPLKLTVLVNVTQKLLMMNRPKTILVGQMTCPATRRRQECMPLTKKLVAIKPWLSILKKVNPNCPALFHCLIRKSWKATNTIWFENRPLGVNKSGRMMADISEAAGLSRIYTDHSEELQLSHFGKMQVFQITILWQSLVHYNKRPSLSQLCNCSNVLSHSLFSGHPPTAPHAQLSINMHTSVAEVAVTLTNTQLQNLSTAGSLFSLCLIGSVQIVFKSSSD